MNLEMELHILTSSLRLSFLSVRMDSGTIPYFKAAVTGVLVLLLASCHYLTKKGRAAKSKKVPEAAGGWPILGHLRLLAGPQLLHKTLGATADKYGPIFTVRLGMNPTLVVSCWELAKELFTVNDAAVISRPPITAAKHLGYNFAMFAYAPKGPYWREIRKIATSELLSTRRIDLLKDVRIREVETSLEELYRHWEEKMNGSGDIVVDLKQWLVDLTLNAILRTVVGKRYNGSDVGDKTKAQQWQKVVRKFFEYLGIFVARDALPFLGWLDIGGHEKAMKGTAKEIDGILEEWLEEHKRKRLSGEGEADQGEQNFMDVMLSVLNDTDVAGYDADTVIKATSLVMIAGASDTTMVTLTWALSLLLNNRRVLAKVQEELNKCVGMERLVTDADISNLVYLRAIVKESLRLYPAAPLLAPRQFDEDCTIGGYHVPKGTWLLVNNWKIQRDSRIWQDPLEFKPERFLTTDKDIDVRGQNFELIPFGSGRRACPGISLGLHMVHLTLAKFLQRFQISTSEDAPVDMTESSGLTNLKATPLEVLVSPRLPRALYT